MNALTRADVNAPMLAQARGCVPWNVCWDDCCQNAQESLDEDRARAIPDDLLEWINERNWL